MFCAMLSAMPAFGGRSVANEGAAARAPQRRPALARVAMRRLSAGWQAIGRLDRMTLALDLALLAAALIPRLALAHSLDLTTDEGVYIPVGQRDMVLLLHAAIASPHWLDNYEAPALPKLFIGAGALLGEQLAGHAGLLFGARLPGVLLSASGLVVASHLARPIVGRRAAWLGGLALALSPWLAYFAALAYLDTYLLVFVTLAYLLLWHAVRRPALFPVVGVLLGLAAASKYTALAAIVPIACYLYYVHLATRRAIPLRAMGSAALAFLATLFLADPAIWVDPVGRLAESVTFEWRHAATGHQVFWFGRVWEHVPPGLGVALALAKLSVVVTVPALGVVGASLARAAKQCAWPGDPAAFLICWLLGLAVPFSGLTIIVGTHYVLPLAPPFAYAGAWGLVQSADWLAPRLPAVGRRLAARLRPSLAGAVEWVVAGRRPTRALLALCVALIALPPAFGLLTIPQAEGYTSEWLPGENEALQVAYPGYADALDWIAGHTSGIVTVALLALPGTLDYWQSYHAGDFPKRLRLAVNAPQPDLPAAVYLVWPAHLIQRGYPVPADWQARIVAAIRGGGTVYCYILRGLGPGG